MKIIKYPSEQEFDANEPMLVLISLNGEEIIISPIDDAVDHHILLRKVNSDTDINGYFRLVVNCDGGDWIFICPPDYKNISQQNKRMECFYNDGLAIIPQALKLIDYDVPIEIPKRYRHHFDMPL